MGRKRFYTGQPCAHGHVAERFVANGVCTDCHARKPDNPELADPGRLQRKPSKRLRKYKLLGNKLDKPIMRLELTPEEHKAILETYAETKSLDKAATVIGLTADQLQSRIASNKSLFDSVKALEARLNLVQEVREIGYVRRPPFEWTPQKRTKLLTVFIDTGDIAEARDTIEVSPSEFATEIKENKEFAKRYEESKPLAAQHLKERAIQLGLKGNDKLLQILLKANFEEFRESDKIKVDVKSNVQVMTDTQLNAGLVALISKYRDRFVLEGDYEEVGSKGEHTKYLESLSGGEEGIIRETSGTGSPGEPESVQENVS